MAFDLAQGVAVLERTPAVLDMWLRDLPEPWVHGTEGLDTWSPHQVVGHLLHGERTDWMTRIRIIVEQAGDRHFAPFDREAMLRDHADTPTNELLRAFREARADNLALLSAYGIRPSHFSLTGVHPRFGDVTLGQLLATWVAHDLSHLTQISRTMAKQYRDAVGPWREFLSVMDR
ncbi:MAG: DinB family protein [Gemmatimonadaceae bacterium]|nr:DinB family protein [Gemmatimonadaceae bacterium]